MKIQHLDCRVMNIWELENKTRELIHLYKRIKDEEPNNKLAQELADSSLPILENLLKAVQKSK
jgi:hypothetical protein